MAIAALLKANPRPERGGNRALPNICRCGIGPRASKAIARASIALTGGDSLGAIARETAPKAEFKEP